MSGIFCSFGTVLFIVNLLIKTDCTVIFVLCMFVEPSSLKELQTWKIFYVNWLNFVYCLKFTSLRPNLSK